MAADIRSLVEASARRYGVPVRIAQNLAMAESSMNPKAVSPAGAIGVLQLLPSTARSLGVNPYDPAQNIEGGIRYLKQQYDRFGSWPLAVAAFNAGPNAVQKHGGIPPYKETKAHVAKVMSGAQSTAPTAQAPQQRTVSQQPQPQLDRLQKLMRISTTHKKKPVESTQSAATNVKPSAKTTARQRATEDTSFLKALPSLLEETPTLSYGVGLSPMEQLLAMLLTNVLTRYYGAPAERGF